jgi:AraC-like DNA-binding protein
MKAFHQTFSPSEALKPYILFYSYIEMPDGMTCNIVPGTTFVMGFYSNGFSSRNSDNSTKPLQQEIFGLQDGPRSFYSYGATRMVTVHFNNLGVQSFINAPLHEIFNSEASLNNFYRQQTVRDIEEQFLSAPSPQASIQLIDKFLQSRFTNASVEPLVLHALRLIRQTRGQIPMKQLSDAIHCSQSLIEKKFKKTMGLSPKKFSSLVRFNSTIYHHQPTIPLTQKAYNAGYFDQAHFTREFKAFTGFPPREVFQNLENIGDFRVFGMGVEN